MTMRPDQDHEDDHIFPGRFHHYQFLTCRYIKVIHILQQ